MADFHLPHRYDAVLCLFSSIGYVRTLERVTAAPGFEVEHDPKGLGDRGLIVAKAR